jgi:TM2 domain-containing membrane protein YozV
MQKSRLTTAILCFFLGYLGIHRFYTGYTKVGIIQLLTGGGLGIWALWDLIQIIRNRYTDASGQMLGA